MELIKKYKAINKNILVLKTEKLKQKGPQTLDNGLVSITSVADCAFKPTYTIISIGSQVEDILKEQDMILLHPAAMGGIIVEQVNNDEEQITETVINITINDILAKIN